MSSELCVELHEFQLWLAVTVSAVDMNDVTCFSAFHFNNAQFFRFFCHAPTIQIFFSRASEYFCLLNGLWPTMPEG